MGVMVQPSALSAIDQCGVWVIQDLELHGSEPFFAHVVRNVQVEIRSDVRTYMHAHLTTPYVQIFVHKCIKGSGK